MRARIACTIDPEAPEDLPVSRMDCSLRRNVILLQDSWESPLAFMQHSPELDALRTRFCLIVVAGQLGKSACIMQHSPELALLRGPYASFASLPNRC